MSDRRTYYVVNHEDGWAIRYQDEIVGTYNTQEDAADVARERARREEPSQVLVQGRDGQWQEESTYGDDPYPPAG